ncbi:MAG TPA: ATP-binding protein [Candidatus Omnitrophota bacterium]|nr:ATP-binding protein [Candidatus Omnitrophota bacterium]
MAAQIRSIDWSATPLGPVSSWSPTLRMMVPFLVANRFPLLLWWGPDYCQIYNDAYRPILGSKHPRSMGQPTRECWTEIWDVLGPLIDTPYRGGDPTWMEDLALEINRHGFLEETHFTVAYSPVPDDTAPGGIGGVLATVHEISEKVVGERRVRALRDLAAGGPESKSVEQACSAAAETIERYPKDIPFALVYLLDADGASATLACAVGMEEGGPASPRTIELRSESAAWPLGEALRSESTQRVEDLALRFGAAVPPGPWADPPAQAAVMPIRSTMAKKLAGFLVAGISPRLRFDESYRSFFELATGQIATAIANARAYEEERRRAEALAEIDRAKTAFFSNVSHEFRTPLTLMLGPLEDALEGEDLAPEERERLGLIHRNALRLSKLVNALLDFSRIEAGRAQATYRPTDLGTLTADLASAFRSAVERAGLELVVRCPSGGEPAWVDPAMWEKIVLNLLSNAFKFTFQGRIEIALETVGREWQLTVRDTGIGIEADDRARIFDRFHRVEGAQGRSYEGSGIGLALVLELARLHGGTARVESAVGQGSAFIVHIPRGYAHLPADRVASGEAPRPGLERTFVEEALRWLPDSDGHRLEPSARDAGGSSRETPASRPLPRVLLADDNADLRDYVRRLLEPHYEVETVPDGEAALESIRRRPPDLVLSDIMMPRRDGFALLRALREDPDTASLPVLLLSARAGEESRVEGLELGADDYLVKPFAARELLARVASRIVDSERRSSESRVRDVLESVSDGFQALDAEGRFRYVNLAMRRMWEDLGRSSEVIGKHVFEVFPEARETTLGRALHRALTERVPIETESFHEPFQRWFLVRHYPSPDGGLSIVSQDITARKQAEERAREGERRKDEFLATLAHELRNPLAPIRNAVAILQSRGSGDVEARWARGVIERQVASMAHLLDDLLDISRIARNTLQLRKGRHTLAEIVQRSLETSQPAIQAAGHRLTLSLPEEDLWLVADPLRLAQVLSNLLNNAAKYTPRGGRIELSGRREGLDVVIAVRDNGIGIAPDFLPQVFEMFVQGAPASDLSEGGLGIGLSLVQGIVTAHGGRVHARSGGPGQGSEFTVHLPVAPPRSEEAAVPAVELDPESIAPSTAVTSQDAPV